MGKVTRTSSSVISLGPRRPMSSTNRKSSVNELESVFEEQMNDKRAVIRKPRVVVSTSYHALHHDDDRSSVQRQAWDDGNPRNKVESVHIDRSMMSTSVDKNSLYPQLDLDGNKIIGTPAINQSQFREVHYDGPKHVDIDLAGRFEILDRETNEFFDKLSSSLILPSSGHGSEDSENDTTEVKTDDRPAH